MARIVQFVDDFTGKPSEDVIPDFKFSVGTDRYVIDITPESEKALREAMAPFIDKARIVMTGKPPTPPAAPTPTTNGNGHQVHTEPSNDAVRAWWGNLTAVQLKVNGLPEPNGGKGRIPKAVTEAFKAATP